MMHYDFSEINHFLNINEHELLKYGEVFIHTTGCGCCSDTVMTTNKEGYIMFLRLLQDLIEKKIEDLK